MTKCKFYDVVVAGGGVAGVASAVAAAKGCDPSEIPAGEVRACLKANGCIVDALREFGVGPGNVENTPEYSEN